MSRSRPADGGVPTGRTNPKPFAARRNSPVISPRSALTAPAVGSGRLTRCFSPYEILPSRASLLIALRSSRARSLGSPSCLAISFGLAGR